MNATSVRRKTFQLYCEPFRPFVREETTSLMRSEPGVILGQATPDKTEKHSELIWSFFLDISKDCLVSYQSHLGGFTICNILLNGKLYSGSSCCSKLDNWLPIRGKMLAFRRALESEGVQI